MKKSIEINTNKREKKANQISKPKRKREHIRIKRSKPKYTSKTK